MSFIHNIKTNYWTLVLGLGNMDAEGEILEEGLMFTVFEEGPWAGFKFPGDPSMGWVSGGKDHYELMVTALNVDLSERYLVQIYICI